MTAPDPRAATMASDSQARRCPRQPALAVARTAVIALQSTAGRRIATRVVAGGPTVVPAAPARFGSAEVGAAVDVDVGARHVAVHGGDQERDHRSDLPGVT